MSPGLPVGVVVAGMVSTVFPDAADLLATALLAIGWGIVGALVAVALARRGEPGATAASALLFWPLLAPVLLQAPAPPEPPAGARIRAAFDRVREALREAGEPVPPDLDALCAAVLAADARLARLLAILAEEQAAGPEELDALRRAHARGAAEIDAVLAELGRVRIQLGLAAVAGEAGPVRARLGDLLARARTLEEVAALRAMLPAAPPRAGAAEPT